MSKHANGTIRLLTLAVLALLAATDVDARSPWTQQKGGGFFQLSGYGIGPYERLYQRSGPEFVLNREVTDNTFEAYGEYGVTDRWTVVAVLPYKLTETGDPVPDPTLTPTTIAAGTFDSLGNAVVGARRKFVDGKFVLSTQFNIEMPTGDFDPVTGLSTGYDAFTFAPVAGIGKGFKNAYVYGYAGLGLRTGDFSSDWTLGLEGGYRFFGRLWLVGMADRRQSFLNGDVQLPRANLETGLYLNDQEFLAYGLKILIDIYKGFGIQGTTYTAASGNNVARSSLSGIGFYYKLGKR